MDRAPRRHSRVRAVSGCRKRDSAAAGLWDVGLYVRAGCGWPRRAPDPLLDPSATTADRRGRSPRRFWTLWPSWPILGSHSTGKLRRHARGRASSITGRLDAGDRAGVHLATSFVKASMSGPPFSTGEPDGQPTGEVDPPRADGGRTRARTGTAGASGRAPGVQPVDHQLRADVGGDLRALVPADVVRDLGQAG